MFYKKKKIIFIAIGLVIIGFFMAISFFTRANKIAVTVDIFPTDARVSIDNNAIRRGTTHLNPGTYTIEASREGFESYSDTITIEENTNSQKSIGLMLTPITDEANKIYENNQDDYARARKLSYKVLQEKGDIFNKKNPIAKKLPYKSLIFDIGYIKDQSDPSGNSILITIRANEGYRQAALYRIRQLGYDPTDLNIIFYNHENPFPL